MSTNGGFFPTGDELLDRFSEMFLGHIRDVNMMGVWYNRDEDWVLRKYCAEAELVELSCLEPFRFAEPWSSTLAGRVVLVVHPFTDSITQQYSEKRALLFDNPNVLPLFELKTVRAVQSIVNTQVDFETWFDAYEFMCREIEKCEFDTAIIGAGPYGLPLASFVKRLGKTAIHLGGVTQVLFGVMGRRWETAYANSIGKLFNEHWVRPNSSETPAEYKNVEDGCYW